MGAAISEAATTAAFAQYFTPPPAPPNFSTASAGLGFYWDDRNDPSIKDKYRFDIAGLIAFTRDTIGNEYIGTEQMIPGTTDTVRLCTDEQVVRTGCPGEYRVRSFWASASFTLQY